ncbi:hypothetical protein HYC85_022395 [Camellia sinensis]|uniref:DC1 domain-containing protein n=1 Tax=Camellia sinensis TaxID=4442 RepID=A0A7J7GPB3_CAMSI|nr:hypothetical protein HYC85_022395 [Camellia sinensis]
MEEYEVKCRVCKQGISDWQHYRCSDDFCTTRIHEYPCSEIPFQIDHHPLHPHHSSLFASSGSLHPNRSDVCGNSCEEAFKYKCVDCPFMLDVKCALLTATATKKIQFQKQQQQQPNHFHPLILCDMVKSFDYTCCCCGLSIDGDCLCMPPVQGFAPQFMRRLALGNQAPISLLASSRPLSATRE